MKWSALVLSAMLFLPSIVVEAVAGRVGPEFRVNTFTANDQRGPSVAPLGGGGFIVTWYSDRQDGSGFGVYGQRYDAAGTPVGVEFRINTRTIGNQQSRSVSALSDGGFLAAWDSASQDSSGFGVYGQRFSASGTPIDGEIRANTVTASHQQSPSIAGRGSTGFVVTWQSFAQDGSKFGIYGQSYSAKGNALGSEFKINTATAQNQQDPSAARLANGTFVVTWSSDVQDGSGAGVYGQRYRAAGTPAGIEFRVNTTTLDNQNTPSIAGLGGGSFVVAWTAEGGQDGSQHGIYARLFAANGVPSGGEFRVNTTTANNQDLPSVARLGDGGFVVTWTSFGQDGSGNGVYGQRFNAAGAHVGGEFRANKFTADDQEVSRVAGLGDGGFVVIWRSNLQDGSGTGIYGQRFGP